MSQAQCNCEFSSKEEAKNQIQEFLRKFGDDLPEQAIHEATECLENWQVFCDCKNKKKVTSGGHWVRNDWYLCTVRHLATDTAYRGQGLAGKITDKLAGDAMENGCLVLAADVTTTNIPSQKIFQDLGFKKVNTFCWKKGAKPANILHYVKMPPEKGKC